MSKKTNINVTSIYDSIRTILENSHKRVIQNVNFEMVTTYWKIGEIIVEEEQHGKERAEFGKGFDVTNLKNMRKFYKAFRKGDAVRHLLDSENESNLVINSRLRAELSWTHNKVVAKS